MARLASLLPRFVALPLIALLGTATLTFAANSQLTSPSASEEPAAASVPSVLVVPGAALAAGSPVGLVGSTGHSTGPHLHLQLQPASAYPQAQAWFQSFAGTAFQWQGDPPSLAAAAVPRSGDVFTEVGAAEPEPDVVFFNR